MEWRVSRCPACGAANFEISKLTCRTCDTKVEGHFTTSRLALLPPEHVAFAEVFLKCRGNIKDVERELGISYPTVRNRLDRLITAMGFGTDGEDRRDILKALENREITHQEAMEALKELARGGNPVAAEPSEGAEQ